MAPSPATPTQKLSRPFLIGETFVTVTTQVSDRDVIITLCENHPSGSIKWQASVRQATHDAAQDFANKFSGQDIPDDIEIAQVNEGWDMYLSMNAIPFEKKGESSKELLLENLIQGLTILLNSSTCNNTFPSFDLLPPPCGKVQMDCKISDIFVTIKTQVSDNNVLVTLCENHPSGSIKWQASVRQRTQEEAQDFADKFEGQEISDDIEIAHTDGEWEMHLSMNVIPFEKKGGSSQDLLLENLVQALSALLGSSSSSNRTSSLFGLPPPPSEDLKVDCTIDDIFLSIKAHIIDRDVIVTLCENHANGSTKWQATVSQINHEAAQDFANKFERQRIADDIEILHTDRGWELHLATIVIPFEKKGGSSKDLLHENLTQALMTLLRGPTSLFNIPGSVRMDGQGLISTFGNHGSGTGQLKHPCGIAIDGKGNIIVADHSNDRIQIFDKNGVFKRKFGTKGSGDRQFDKPYGVAVDGKGNIIVSDAGNNRIQVFNRKGVFKRKFGTEGSEDGQFDKPYGVAIDGDSNIVVSDFNNHRVQVFDKKGNFKTTFGSNGSGDGLFINPGGIVIDAEGNIVVSDFNNHRIQVFDKNGIFVREFGTRGLSDGQFNHPEGVAIDGEGNFIIVDSSNHRIQILDTEGSVKRVFECHAPVGVVVDSQGKIIVTEYTNGKISVYI